MENLTALIATVLITFNFHPTDAHAQEPDPPDTITTSQPVTTQSRFTEKIEETTEVVPKGVTYIDDPETEAGIETVLDEGEDGKVIKQVKITYYDGEEYSREVVATQTIPAKDKKISRGTKIIWKNLDTPDGNISYWSKLHVWATQYDSHCPGCDDYTATGLKQGKGVIAVDPRVIPLGTKLYIPGYGMAVAGDTGGAIKGNVIDVGFPDAHTSGWISHFVDVYLITN